MPIDIKSTSPALAQQDVQRFWKSVNRGGADECWFWTGCADTCGYGLITIGGRKGRAYPTHRVSFVIHRGPIPPGAKVCHRCDRPPCCNPEHLFLGTQADNVHDMFDKNRRPALIGVSNPKAKLTEDQVRYARRRLARGHLASDLARELGVTKTQIGAIKHRRQWKHLPERPDELPRFYDHSFRVELRSKTRGESNGRSRLSEEKVRAIRSLLSQNPSSDRAYEEALARQVGVSRSTIQDIKHGRSWRHVG
jgi:DNA-binding XRE family transcriptional regulator